MMPDLSGWDVSVDLKSNEETKDVPIAMLTVRTSKDSVEKSFSYGLADAHIAKPAKSREILETIDTLLLTSSKAKN
jgi:DNA-binding response OmpR family regulator